MNKKLMVVLALVAIGTMVYGVLGAGAWFSDKEVASGNSFTAGTIDLKTNNVDGVSKAYSVKDVRPGSWDLSGQITLKNSGSLPGHLWIEIVNVENQENECIDPEVKAGDASCDALAGELGQFVKPSFQLNAAPWTRYGGSDTLNASAGKRVDVMDLQPGQSIPMTLWATWHDSSDQDNLAQSDGATFDVVFHLDQIH